MSDPLWCDVRQRFCRCEPRCEDWDMQRVRPNSPETACFKAGVTYSITRDDDGFICVEELPDD